MKAAIYQKMKSEDPSDRLVDPTDIELHYWLVEAKPTPKRSLCWKKDGMFRGEIG